MSRPLNKLEDVYEFLQNFVDSNGYPPSVREICSGVGIKSTATVHVYLSKLDELGRIKKTPLSNRAYGLPDRQNGLRGVLIPVVGKIAAGIPITAQENIDDEFMLPKGFFKNGNLFILKVQGDSMINAGILNGDHIIIREQKSANNGEIVAALVDGEATVKRFYKEKDHYRLQPENDTMKPIIVDDLEIVGIVTGLLRNYKS